jgi:hypothetical protein
LRIRLFLGAALVVALLSVGVLAGSVFRSGASAQTPAATPIPSTTNPSAPTPSTTTPSTAPSGGKEGAESGLGGSDGFGREGRGHKGLGAATAAGASAQITNTTNLINQAKSDLGYANGKMDTTDVQRWLNGADSLLKSAQSANSSSQYGQAVGYARAASQLVRVADTQMAQKLGADKLPSYSQQPNEANEPNEAKGATPSNTTVTQAQASRVLAHTYERLVMQGTLVKSASNAAEATTYLTDAQNAYKAAYAAYQAGKYGDAVASARLADGLAGVAGSIIHAVAAPRDANTPVTVPAPNF